MMSATHQGEGIEHRGKLDGIRNSVRNFIHWCISNVPGFRNY